MSVQELDPGAFVVLLLKSPFACVTSMVAVIRMDTLILCYYINIGKHWLVSWGERHHYNTNYCILISIVLGLRAIIIKDIFLTDQNVIKAKCSNVVFFSCSLGTFRIQQASGWHGTNLPRASLLLKRYVMLVCCSLLKSFVCILLR